MQTVHIERKEVFNPSQQEYVKEELPTISLKAAVRATHCGAGTALISKDLGGGTEMRLTFYRVSAGTPTEFYMRDRGGTFDYPFLESRGAEVGIGAPNEPLHVVRGTFEIGLVGSQTLSTFIAAYEGIIAYQGTESWD